MHDRPPTAQSRLEIQTRGGEFPGETRLGTSIFDVHRVLHDFTGKNQKTLRTHMNMSANNNGNRYTCPNISNEYQTCSRLFLPQIYLQI